ncbi:hypothetical protein HN747_02025 [archaeon]|jgi:hypothetical protein|nr:hypothetical protein [archaeon]
MDFTNLSMRAREGKSYQVFGERYGGQLSEKKTVEALTYFHSLVYEENDLKLARELYVQFHEETRSRVKSNKYTNMALRTLSFRGV